MDFTEFVKVVPSGASVLAVLFVVILFLKQQDKISLVLKSLADACHISHQEARKDYQQQVLMLVEGYKNSTERQTSATKDLEKAVQQLNNSILLSINYQGKQS